MQHSLMAIAAGRFLDLHKLSEFAGNAGKKYVCDDGSITSWDVDDFVKAYREHIGPQEDAKDRKRLTEDAVDQLHANRSV